MGDGEVDWYVEDTCVSVIEEPIAYYSKILFFGGKGKMWLSVEVRAVMVPKST